MPWQSRALIALSSPDLNASAHARVLVQYVVLQGDGEHEIGYQVLMRLLRCGEDKVRTTIREAEGIGLVVTFATGRGHAPRFRFGVGDSPTLSTEQEFGVGGFHTPSDRVGDSPTPTTDRVGDSPTSNCTSSPPAPSTPPSAGASAKPDDPSLAELRTYLGEHSDALDRLDRSAPHGTTWPAAVWGAYRPPLTKGVADGGGTEWPVLAKLSAAAMQPAALAKALNDYADKGEVFKARFFRGFVEMAVRETRQREKRLAAGIPDDPPPRRRWAGKQAGPMDAQTYEPTTEFQGFNA